MIEKVFLLVQSVFLGLILFALIMLLMGEDDPILPILFGIGAVLEVGFLIFLAFKNKNNDV